MNSLFNSLNPMGGIMQQFQAFRQNPMQFLLQRRINIPQECMNDPRQAVQHLMNSGQMSNEQFNRLSQIVRQMGGNL